MNGPLFATREVSLSAAEQRLYGVDHLDLGPQHDWPLKQHAAGVKAVQLQEIWYEEPLGTDWIAAYRLSFNETKSRIVVGEIRIFPSAPPRARNTGRWIADVLGSDAPVPPGGIKSRNVLKKVRLRAFQKQLGKLFKNQRVSWKVGPAPPPQSGLKRGRKPLPELHYAQVAIHYENAYIKNSSSHPTADVAQVMRLKKTTARAQIDKARRLGLLTETERGEGSGRATKRAHALVKAAKRRRGI